MKEKKIKIRYIVLSFILILIIGIISVFVYFINNPLLIGHFVVGKENTYFIIHSHGTTIMTNGSQDENLFEGVKTGDKIIVVYTGAILQSYPSQTTVYSCKILKKGSLKDVPQEAYNKLKEYGWIPNDE